MFGHDDTRIPCLDTREQMRLLCEAQSTDAPGEGVLLSSPLS